MKFKYITLINIRNFRKLEKFQLQNRGMVLVQGINGTGKTTIPNCIRACLFGSMNDGSKLDDLIRGKKDGSIFVEFEKDGQTWEVTVARVKGKWNRKLVINGQDETAHSQTNFYTELVKKLKFTSEEWDASIHLSQRGSHILVSGKPAARKDYISEFFGIDGDFDKVKSASEIELTSITKQISEIESFSTAKSALQAELDQIVVPDLASYASRREVLISTLSNNNSSISSLKEKKSLYDLYTSNSSKAYPEGYGEEIDIDYSVSHYTKLAAEAQALAKNYNQSRAYNEQAGKNNILFEDLTKAVAQNGDFDTRFPESVEVYQKEMNDLELKLSFSQERVKVQKMIDSLKEYEGKEAIDSSELSKREVDLKTKNGEYAVLDHEYKRISQGKCPTCGHEHEATNISAKYEEILALHKIITELSTSISSDNALNKKINELNQHKQKLEGIPEFTANESLRLDELKHVLPQLRVHINKKQQLSTMSRQTYLDLPSTPPTAQEISNLEYSIKFFTDVSNARKTCPKPSEVAGIDMVAITAAINETNNKNANIEEDIRSIDASVLNANNAKARYDRIADQINIIDQKFSTLGTLKEAEYFWKTMVQAYGPKGIRVHQLEKVMNLITDVLPLYTSMMFEASREYSFYSECDAGNISIMVKRKDEEGEYGHDIATLSGGEGKRIAVCIILAVAKIRLAKKSCNILVLDEVDSQMDPGGRFCFVNELLPYIKDSFDTVFVVSHHGDTFQNAIYDEKLYFEPESEKSHYTKITSTKYEH